MNVCNASIIKESVNDFRIIIRLEYSNLELLGNSPEHCIGKAHQELQKQGKLLGEVSGVSEHITKSKTSVVCKYFGNDECDADIPCVTTKHNCIHF